MPLSHYRQYVPWLQVFLDCGTAFQVALFPLSCSHFRWCKLWLKVFGAITLSFNYHHSRFVFNLLSQWRNIHVPPLTLCCHITPKHNQITTLCTTWTTPSITVVRNLYAQNCLPLPTILNSEAEIINI